MSIANEKIVNLQDAKVLYDDLRGRIAETNTYEKSITESSAIQSFDDGANWPMKLNVAVDPVQDLHGYDHPWPGGGGKNKCPVAASGTYNGIVLTNNIDGSITLTGTNTSSATYIDCFPGTFDSTVYAGYVFSYGDYSGNTGSVQVRISGSDRTALQNHNSGETIITDNGTGLYLSIRIAASYAIPSGGITLYPMLREPSATADWEPYSNICPITGWDGANVTVTGKNLIRKLVAMSNAGLTVSVNEDNSVNVTGTPTSNDLFATKNYGNDDLLYLKAGTYRIVLTTNISVSGCAIRIGESNGTFIAQGTNTTFTLDKSRYIKVAFRIQNNSGTALNFTAYPMLLLADETDFTYEVPATTYSITFPTSAGTVFGGTLSVNKDGTGELVVDTAFYEFDGSEDESWNISTSSSNTYRLGSIVVAAYNSDERLNAIGSSLPCASISLAGSEIGFGLSANNQIRIRYGLFETLTVSELKTYLSQNPLQVAYKIATPVTYSLTPGQILSIIGQNNVWADTGDILSLTYNSKQGIEFIREDTAGQINTVVDPVKEELADAEAAMAIVVDGDTAPKNITSGQYVFVKNHSTLATGMYHATAAISSGASITSSNVQADADGIANLLRRKAASFTLGTIPAKSYMTFTDSSVKNKLIVGHYMSGVASKDVSILGVYSDTNGTHVVARNIGDTDATPNNLIVFYIG